VIHKVHTAVQGRARYRVKELYRSESLKEYLETRLLRHHQVNRAIANTLTGNVLVLYNSGNSADTIGSLLERVVSDYFNLAGSSTGDSPFSSSTCGHASRRGQDSVSSPPSKRPSRIREKLGSLLSIRTCEQDSRRWHTLDVEYALTCWSSSKELGLSTETAGKHLKEYGPNVIPEPGSRSKWSILINQLQSFPVGLLVAAAGVSVFTGGLADAVVIMGVVFINTTIGFVTEHEAERTILSLKTFARPSTQVIRDGKSAEIPIEEVVPGDILVLKPGTYVAADSRLVEADNLSVDESALTGESMPAVKSLAPVESEAVPLADRVNMIFMGTVVTGGQGLAVVVATGRFTEIGQLQSLVGEAHAPETPMERQLRRIGNQLFLVSAAACGIILGTGIARGHRFTEVLKVAISLAVAAVPEGLPAVATTTLALGIRNMNRQAVLIRRLDAVEALGALQTICFDKTGTVTENRMSVQRLHTGMQSIAVRSDGFYVGEEKIDPSTREEISLLICVSVLCSETDVGIKEGDFVLQGSSTENALITMAIHSGADIIALRRQHSLIETIHRTEDRPFMGTLHETPDHGRFLAVKGSPLEVLAISSFMMKDGEKIPLTGEDRARIEVENERMAGNALRVLGLAYSTEGLESLEDPGRLTWLGLIGMADPIRSGVKELIGLFHKAGIDTIMITGDQSPTAYAVGKELDLSNGKPLEILDSTDLERLDAETLKGLAERAHVFARVSPAHKLQIVQGLQRAGRIVGMTGDGINDGPALKAADIGIALGHAGTDIAREVADVVLENDKLDTMIVAVSHGRTIYSNIRKSLHFLFSTNFSEMIVMFIAGIAGIGYPLTAMQLLWINLISDIFPGIALALEPAEPDILSEAPRSPDEPIIRSADFKRIGFESSVMTIGTLSSYGYGIMRYGMNGKAGTLAFQTLTMSQLLHSLSCRSEIHTILDKERLPPNRYLDAALAGSLLIQFTTLLIPGLRRILGASPLGLTDGVLAGGTALLTLTVNETTKKISQRK